MPAPNTTQMAITPVPPSIWWRPGSPSSSQPATRKPPTGVHIFLVKTARVCGSSAGSTYYCMHGSALCSMVCGQRPCQRLYGDKPAPMRPAKHALRPSICQITHVQILQAGHRDGGDRWYRAGVPGWASRSRGARRKGGSAPVCGRLAALFAVVAVFFLPFCQFSKRLVTHLRRISGRGHGGRGGEK